MKGDSWREVLATRLPLFGHRNWVAVLDAAFPAFSSPGIEMLVAREEHLTVLEHVGEAIRSVPHVDAVPLVAEELEWVDLPVAKAVLQGLGTQRRFLPHDEILTTLDDVSRRYRMLALKTTCTTPYTSVFFDLGCGYWSDAEESELRGRMRS